MKNYNDKFKYSTTRNLIRTGNGDVKGRRLFKDIKEIKRNEEILTMLDYEDINL